MKRASNIGARVFKLRVDAETGPQREQPWPGIISEPGAFVPAKSGRAVFSAPGDVLKNPRGCLAGEEGGRWFPVTLVVLLMLTMTLIARAADGDDADPNIDDDSEQVQPDGGVLTNPVNGERRFSENERNSQDSQNRNRREESQRNDRERNSRNSSFDRQRGNDRQRFDRRESDRRETERRFERPSNFSRESLGSASGVESTNLAGVDVFRLIWERNIFNPFRSPRNIGGGAPPPRPRRTDVLSLVGTMAYEKGYFAFFDGSSSNYRKVAQPNETIADYTVKEVGPNSVTLIATNGNEVRLTVGMQMRKRDDEDWQLSSYGASLRGESSTEASTESGDTNATAASAAASAAPGEDSDVLARLLKRKEEEK